MSVITNLPDKYTSKGKVISRSLHHSEMWIIDSPNGKWHNITTSDAVMAKLNPPDDRKTVRVARPMRYLVVASNKLL